MKPLKTLLWFFQLHNMDKPNGDGTSACSMCQTHTDKFCAGCKKAYYCCVEHQKSHRKIHKKDCFPAVLKYNADFGGRCFTASRNIKQGETIFKDKALLSGPSGAEMFFHFICLGCYRQVKPESTYKCSTCGWVPNKIRLILEDQGLILSNF